MVSWIVFVYDISFWHIYKFFASSRYENHCQIWLFGVFVDAIFLPWEGFMIITMLFPAKSFIKSNISGEILLPCGVVKEQSALCTFKIYFFYQIDHLKLLWIRKGSAIGCWVGFLIRIQVYYCRNNFANNFTDMFQWLHSCMQKEWGLRLPISMKL